METMKLSSDEISKLQNLGNGACGTVYKYGNDLAIKILNNKGFEQYNEDTFSEIVGIENETCVFPKCKVEVDGRFQGYVMNYINGCLLWDVVRSIDLETLILALQKAEADIDKLTKDKIKLEDVNQGGLMWSKDSSIQIIDTDAFKRDEFETEEALNAQNQEQFNQAILAITHFVFNQPVYEYLLSNIEFSELVTIMDTAVTFEEAFTIDQLFSKALEIFKDKFGVMPINIAEMETILKENNLFMQKEAETEIPVFESPLTDEIPKFSEMDIGKTTRNVPVQQKEKAQKQVMEDEQKLAQEKQLHSKQVQL